jgi:heat shock protein HtpX
MRIFLFMATNVAVLVLVTIIMSLFGVEQYFQQQGVPINLTGLLIFCALFGMIGSFISLAMSKWLAKRGTGAKVITEAGNQTERWLVDTVSRLSRRAGIGMPEVAIFPSPQPNAFATGMTKNSSLVAVSSGLLQHMQPNEVEAVLGHEIGHIANGDMVTMTLLQGVLNTFVLFFSRIIGYVVDRVVFKNERGHGPGFWIVTIVAQIVLGILATIIVMWFSRYREFRADVAGASLSGRGNMIAALERLRIASEMPNELPDSLTAFGITGGGFKQGFQALFRSHPPLADRITALQGRTF